MDRSRYRYVNFIGGRILQAREMDKLQDITRGVDDNNQPSALDLDAIFQEGALYNVTPVVTPNTKTVTLTRTDGTLPMMVFVRGRWEMFKDSEVPPITLQVAQTKFYLNWVLKRITYGPMDGDTTDSLLKDITTDEAAAEMGELRLSVSAVDDSARAAGDTEIEKNLSPVVLYNFTHQGNTVLVQSKDNVTPQAYATPQSGGLVKTTTYSSTVVSTDDPRMTDARVPVDASVTDGKVRTPQQDGAATNADGSPRFDLAKDLGGIGADKIVHRAKTELVSDLLDKHESRLSSLEAEDAAHDTAPLGQADTHPMPTATQVGATPASHQSLSLDAAHGLGASKNSGGFSVTRDKAVAPTAGDGAFRVKDQDGDLAKLTHDGDVFSKKANSSVAAALLEGADTNDLLGNGPLGALSAIAKALAAHVNKKSHNNPHGLTAGDLNAATVNYVDTAVAEVLQSAENYTNAMVPGLSLRLEAVTGGLYVILRFAPNNANAIEIAYGTGTVGNGGQVHLPANFEYANALISLSLKQIDYIFGTVAGLYLNLGANGAVSTNDVRFDGSGSRKADGHPTASWMCLTWRQGA